MAIDRIQDTTPVIHSGNTDKTKSPKKDQGQNWSSSSVSLEEARSIAAEAKQLAQNEPIDESKIKAVKDAILSGQYRIDSIKVARKLLGYE